MNKLLNVKPKKYRVKFISNRNGGGYSGSFIVYATSSRRAIMMACMCSGVPSFVCLSKLYFGGAISLSAAIKFLTSRSGLGMIAFAN